MAGVFWMMGLALLAQGFWFSLGDMNVGCKKWIPDKQSKGNVYCLECLSGNRLVKKSGPNPKELCTPCKPGTFTPNSMADECLICTQCVGALVHLANCTAKSDTKCGCEKGRCGDEGCTFCVDECAKGYEPNNKRSCTPCPDGTFNDQIHQKCKPLTKSCPDPNHIMVFKGNASSDIICQVPSPSAIPPVTNPQKPKEEQKTEQTWPIVSFLIITGFMTCLFIFIILVCVLIHRKGKKEKTQRTPSKTPIIRTPTDDPRTLIAIECSFHEAQQEQGSSTESLISKDTSDQETV